MLKENLHWHSMLCQSWSSLKYKKATTDWQNVYWSIRVYFEVGEKAGYAFKYDPSDGFK